MTWYLNNRKEKVFSAGRQHYQLAAQTAAACHNFIPDDEDEQVCDDPRSCYNCRYRRWLPDTFACLKEW